MPSITTNFPTSSFTYILPSREIILAVLREAGKLMDQKKLAKVIGVKKNEYEALTKRLKAMQRDGQIEIDQKGLIKVLPIVNFLSGVVIGHRDGYGFFRQDDEIVPDIFLSQREMHRLMHGDKVLVRLLPSRGRKSGKEGRAVEILERKNHKIIGCLFSDLGKWYVRPSEVRIPNLIEVPEDYLLGACNQDMVLIEIIQYPDRYTLALGKVIRIIGKAGEAKTEIEVIARKLNIPIHFSLNAERYALNFSHQLISSDVNNRTDLRHLAFVTIDDEEAKDFDDAIYAEPTTYHKKEAIRLLVAIADVSYYVHDGDPVDIDAFERSCSVYFPQFVIPMLPEALSNDLCSLRPKVDRLVLVCDALISSSGKVLDYKFYPSVICSAGRLTYTQAASLLNIEHQVNSSKEIEDNYLDTSNIFLKNRLSFDENVHKSLQTLKSLYDCLSKARSKRGAINFDTMETSILYDENGKIRKIVQRERNDAHRLVEECMLVANVCAANFLHQSNHPILYRIHAGPTDEKLKLLRIYLHEIGLELSGGDKPKAKDYANLMRSIKNRPDFSLLQIMLLRSLQQAIYSPNNIGHFGLAYSFYAHFTSPIRRYPDLLVHRAIYAVLSSSRYIPKLRNLIFNSENKKNSFSDEVKKKYASNSKHDNNFEFSTLATDQEVKLWEKIGLICSRNERRAEEASRDIDLWFKCCFMKDKIGDVFEGVVSGVTAFGLFVTIKQFFIEGFLHISDIGKGRITFDEDHQKLVDETSSETFALQDQICVQVMKVDIHRRKIFLSLRSKTFGMVATINNKKKINNSE